MRETSFCRRHILYITALSAVCCEAPMSILSALSPRVLYRAGCVAQVSRDKGEKTTGADVPEALEIVPNVMPEPTLCACGSGRSPSKQGEPSVTLLRVGYAAKRTSYLSIWTLILQKVYPSISQLYPVKKRLLELARETLPSSASISSTGGASGSE